MGLPTPNPIDSGYLRRGAPCDYTGRKVIHCQECGSDQQAETYTMILGRYGGFGAPFFVRPFLKSSSTKGKLGKKGNYAICCRCNGLWSQDQGARDALEAEGLHPNGVVISSNPSRETSA